VKEDSRALIKNYIPDESDVWFPQEVVEANVVRGDSLCIYPKTRFKEELKKIWELFPELEKRKKQNSGKLSGGEKQMLALGRALIINPKMLLMDEPSLGLSPKLVKYMMGHIRKINREFGVTVLIVEQKVREVLEVCHHIYSIKLGKIAYSGKPDMLKTDKQKLKELFL